MSKILNQVRGFWISMPTFWTNSFGCKAPLMLVEVQRCATSFLGASFFSPLRKPVSFFFSSHSPFETALSSAASHGILFNVRVSMCLRAVDPALCLEPSIASLSQPFSCHVRCCPSIGGRTINHNLLSAPRTHWKEASFYSKIMCKSTVDIVRCQILIDIE